MTYPCFAIDGLIREIVLAGNRPFNNDAMHVRSIQLVIASKFDRALEKYFLFILGYFPPHPFLIILPRQIMMPLLSDH